MDIVVVNYHTPYDLERFLGTLSTFPPSEDSTLTIVDVETVDREKIMHWAGGDAHLLGVASNIGYGRACNLAADRGSDDIIALFNADVEITCGALDACARELRSHETWAILSPRQVDLRGRITHAGIFGTPASPAHRGWQEPNRGQYIDVTEAVTVSGSAFFIKRKVWNELTECQQFQAVAPGAIGAFLPTPHYYEETWACYHARSHGYQVVYFGQVTMIHKWHRASRLGGWAEQQMPTSRNKFRDACDRHGIVHD